MVGVTRTAAVAKKGERGYRHCRRIRHSRGRDGRSRRAASTPNPMTWPRGGWNSRISPRMESRLGLRLSGGEAGRSGGRQKCIETVGVLERRKDGGSIAGFSRFVRYPVHLTRSHLMVGSLGIGKNCRHAGILHGRREPLTQAMKLQCQ